MYCSSLLASTLDEYSQLLCSLFPPFLSSRLTQPDARAQEPDATIDDNSYYTRGAYYYVQTANDDQEYFRRIPGRRPAPLSICIPICASHLMATCLTYVCTQILLLSLTRLRSSTCIRAHEAPVLYYDACMTYLCFRVVL